MINEPDIPRSSIGTARISLARFEGFWYLAEWDGIRTTVVLDKSPPMPGVGFSMRRSQFPNSKMMSRVVPKASVEILPVLAYRGIRVAIVGLDDASATLRMRLCRSNGYDYGEERVDLSCLGRDGWTIPDPKDQVWLSPFIDVDDPRLEKGIGELR